MRAAEARQIGEWLVSPDRHESRDRPAVVGDHDLPALTDVVEQARQSLSRFAHTGGPHTQLRHMQHSWANVAADYNADLETP